MILACHEISSVRPLIQVGRAFAGFFGALFVTCFLQGSGLVPLWLAALIYLILPILLGLVGVNATILARRRDHQYINYLSRFDDDQLIDAYLKGHLDLTSARIIHTVLERRVPGWRYLVLRA